MSALASKTRPASFLPARSRRIFGARRGFGAILCLHTGRSIALARLVVAVVGGGRQLVFVGVRHLSLSLSFSQVYCVCMYGIIPHKQSSAVANRQETWTCYNLLLRVVRDEAVLSVPAHRVPSSPR